MTGSPSLARFRWHTGATLSELRADEVCPVLFRDVGLCATRRFLDGALSRIAGPYAPITYMRTFEYREPYDDFDRTGRLVLLRPRALGVWRSGVPHVFVADARLQPAAEAIAWVPGHVALADAARALDGAVRALEVREAFGGAVYDDARVDARARLEQSERDALESEVGAELLRRGLTSRERGVRERALALLDRASISERDLCAAWNHVPLERREHLRAALAGMSLELEELARMMPR